MKRIVWIYGLCSGGVMGAMMLLTMPFVDAIGMDHAQVIGYTTIVAAFLLVFFGVRSYRDSVAHGTIGFGRALAIGMLIVLVASACYVAAWEVIYFGLAPQYGAKMEAYAVAKAKADGASPEAVRKKVQELRQFSALYQNPAINAAITFVEPLPVGIVVALVSAGVLSRRRRGTPSSPAATT